MLLRFNDWWKKRKVIYNSNQGNQMITDKERQQLVFVGTKVNTLQVFAERMYKVGAVHLLHNHFLYMNISG